MLRKIIKQDINKIYELGSKYLNNFSSTYALESYLNNENYLCFCYEEEDIKGFILCLNTVDNIEIELVFVDEEYRKQGIGKKLVEKMFEYQKSVLLEVSVENVNAINLYTDLGFKEISRRIGYYNGIDAIIMKKEF